MTMPFRTDDSFASDPCSERWLKILTQVTPNRPIDLDLVLCEHDMLAQSENGRVLFENDGEVPLAALNDDTEFASIGIRISADAVPDAEALAKRAGEFAALAVERNCEIIAISEGDLSGFERFGIRTERLSGETEEEREICLEQIRAFWSMAIII